MTLLALITVFRMIVIPVQFEDRNLETSAAQQQALVQQAQDYFNRQFEGSGQTFQFDLGPVVTLPRKLSWYGTNYPDRRDVRLGEAVRDACSRLPAGTDWSLYDGDGDGEVDNVFLLFAGPGEHDSGREEDIYPQQGSLSPGSSPLNLGGRRIDRFAVSPEGQGGVFCHEFAHVLGLPDLYDTDGEDSGGIARGYLGTSLLDEGCRRDPVPDFGALEYELLGLGRCDTLRTGSYTLAPLSERRRYLKAPMDRKDEFYLFEAVAGGLRVSHIDRSDNTAGPSPRHEEELTALDRWDYGEVNNNPDHPCARLIPADPDATDAGGILFPGRGSGNFGSDTPAAFRAWSGRSPGLALTNIRPDGAGGVSFEVIEPLTLTDLSVYQDAAVVRWKADPALVGIRGFAVSWTDGEDTWEHELPPGSTSFTLEGLQAQTAYRFSVQVRMDGSDRYSVDGGFVTKVLRKGTYPYIYLSGTLRNVDGSFPAGSKIPLRVFNATDVEEVEWTLDGERIFPEADGRFTLRRSGTLRARVIHTDGSSESLFKQITVL